MTILDKARGSAERGMELGRARMDEMRARWQHRRLLQQLGEACYAEHTGTGTHEAVDQQLAAVTAHERMMSDKRTVRRPDTARQARDIMHPGAECIGENDSVATAAQRMRDLGVGSLPICGADDRLH
ncbi:MAG TPA: CBS domain-containing protein, partial [Actinoplanes sp.]|nr:CBS domain-containing protein [Actinoplanes sp.]